MRETGKAKFGTTVNFMLAGSAAAIGRAAAHPFSVLKIQSQSGMPGGRMGTLTGAYWLWTLNGPSGFLRALPASLARIFPHVGIQFTLFDQYRRRAYVPLEQPNVTRMSNTFVVGGLAHNVATLLTHPLDVVKTRLIVQPYNNAQVYYANEAEAAAHIFKQEGLSGLYRGLAPSLLGGFIFSGVMFTAWDVMDCLPWRRRNAPFFYGETFALSVLAVGAAHVASHPFDLIRKKLMASSPSLPNGGYTDVKTTEPLMAILRAYRLNGFRGFYHGNVANLMKVTPQVTAYWLCYHLLAGV